MRMRLATLTALLGAAAALLVAPAAASAAPSPWWQLTAGAQPTNLWLPKSGTEEQELKTEKFLGAVFAAKVEVAGQVVGCLGTGALFETANETCEKETSHSAIETAEELEALLEGPSVYGADNVEVSGGPVGGAPFIVKTPNRWLPAVKLRVLTTEFEGMTYALGTAGTKILTEGSGRLVLTAVNLGDAPLDATATPLTVSYRLPAGLSAYDAAGRYIVQEVERKPFDCAVKTAGSVSCEFSGTLPPFGALEVEVFVVVTDTGGGASGEFAVSGGNAPSASIPQRVTISEEETPFGLQSYSARAEAEGGETASEAGSHPFQFTTAFELNRGPTVLVGGKQPAEEPVAMLRNARFELPPGLIASTTVVDRCSGYDFLSEVPGGLIPMCPAGTAVGIASVAYRIGANSYAIRTTVPVFNLEPAYGEPARFGFEVGGVKVYIDTRLETEHGYRVFAYARNVSELAETVASTVVLWGTPGDPRHHASRGNACLTESSAVAEATAPCGEPPATPGPAYLRLPVSCGEPLRFPMEAEPWNVPLGSELVEELSESAPLEACNRLPFAPSIAAAPTSKLAESPSGLDFNLSMPNVGLENPAGIAETQPKKVEVTLPEGMTVNPSEAEGLAVCTEADYKRETVESRPGEGCPEASKIGSIEIETPLLEEKAHGALYLAKPYENEFNSLLALYMVARIPDRGVLVKQAGEVKPDPKTGQLVTTFDNLPQLPFSSFKLHFREGGRAPLVTPPSCDANPSEPGNQPFTTVAKFVPWSAQDPNNPAPEEIIERTSPFTIERGTDGGACPGGGLPPFRPGLIAGSTNNAAGRYSPFYVRLTRTDAEQEITHFSIKLPPGVVGKLAGIPFCPDAAIAAAKARTGPLLGGHEELEHPSCPQASEIGHTLVGAGVGSVLTYVPGKLYLAGPYNGAPISIVSITSGVAGPFDLGTVVVREALKINPETAEVFVDATGSDPIPHIIQGIPVHLRDIRVYVNRPEFVLNPTSCEPTSTASTVLGSGLDFASEADDVPVTVSTRFQAAGCSALPFKPRLKLSLKGKTTRGAHPRLKAVLRMNGIGEAAISRAQVTLPHSEFLDQGHLNNICTRVQFREGGGNGEKCPKASVYGWARARTPILSEPLEGPVFLRSSEHHLPDLVAALHSGEINIDLDGRIDSLHGQIRNTFEAVPDAPVSSFTLEMRGGRKGLLVNSENLCRGKHRAIVNFDAHNGKISDSTPALGARCAKHRGRHRHRRAR